MKNKDDYKKLPTVSELVIDAIATYICIEAGRQDVFTIEVDIDNIAQMLSASEDDKQKSRKRAKELLSIFYHDHIDQTFKNRNL